MYRDRVRPHWLGDGAKFWYRVSVSKDGYEFILVDADKGLREPAFDHARLAKALNEAGIQEALPQKLPLDNLEFEAGGEAILFRAGRRDMALRFEGRRAEGADTAGSATVRRCA